MILVRMVKTKIFYAQLRAFRPTESLLFKSSMWVLAIILLSSVLMPMTAQTSTDRRAVLITGTSSGIGLRMTEVLSENGFFVYAGVRTPEDYARLNAMDHVQAVQLDVTIQSDIDAAVAFISSQGRGLYGLINNAGVAVLGPLIELHEEDMKFQLDVNLLGPYRITKAFADLIIESKGRIMTVSSISGILSGQMMGAYSMSKHGVEAFTDALAAELKGFNVQVAAVEPGNYKSQIIASMVERMKDKARTVENSRYGSMLDRFNGPLDRSQYKEPDDVALAALHFLTSEIPQRRYMVVPNKYEAEITIKQMFRELNELNMDQPFSFTRDELIAMLDETLGITSPQISASTPNMSLHEAAMTGDIENMKKLIATGADLNVKEPLGGSSPLLTAATFGHTDVVKALIQGGADLNLKNNDGSTALITAAFFCREDIVEALLQSGADKSIRNNSGATALDVVTAPFEAVENIYDYLGSALAPLGLKLDYERIKSTRPIVAKMIMEK